MSKNRRRIAQDMAKRISDFLTQNRENQHLGWPRIEPLSERKNDQPQQASPTVGLRVLIVGDLTLELPIHIEATRAGLHRALRGTIDDTRLRWEMSQARVGGFVLHAAEAAYALGAKVSVCTVVPVPMPQRFESFFAKLRIEKRFLTAAPGPCPVTAVFSCTDGVVPIPCRTIASAVSMNWPPAARSDFDVILVDPNHQAHHEAITRSLAACLKKPSNGLVTGLRVDHTWSRRELALAHDNHVWTFISRREARLLADKLSGGDSKRCGVQDDDGLLKIVQREAGLAKLVMQRGDRGASLVNGLPCPYSVHTCPVEQTDRVGLGDTLMTVTTLSSAVGGDDRISLRRGVAAATALAAGLELPRCLDELDLD